MMARNTMQCCSVAVKPAGPWTLLFVRSNRTGTMFNKELYMTKRNEKRKAIEMRKDGATIVEIADSLNVAKSTAYTWTKSIELVGEAKHRIDEMRKKGRFKKGMFMHFEECTDEMRIALSIRSRELYKNNARVRHRLTLSNSVHRQIEKDAKDQIEQFFGTSHLLPQKINGRWFDFVNCDFVIEYTTDNTKGISDAIGRFGDIIEDDREKILISPEKWFGDERKARLNATGAIFIPIDTVINN